MKICRLYTEAKSTSHIRLFGLILDVLLKSDKHIAMLYSSFLQTHLYQILRCYLADHAEVKIITCLTCLSLRQIQK